MFRRFRSGWLCLLLFSPVAVAYRLPAQVFAPLQPALLDDSADDPVPVPAARPGATGPYRIAGRLLDAKDGHPLPHAGVTLFNTDSGAIVAETQTGPSGAFGIPALPAGKYRIQGTARGYVTAAYDEHGQFSSAIVTGAGINTESLLLKLQPAARISGHVTDEAGEAVRNATVTLFRESTESGVRRITTFRNGRVNDLGEYEITRVPAGTYFMTVRGVPWYATHPLPPEIRPDNIGIASSVDPALDVAYPLLFYPEARDSSGASPVRLKAGDHFIADFRLTPEPAVHLLFHMEGSISDPGRRPNIPQLGQRVFDSVEPVVQQGLRIEGSTAVISGLSPGPYVLRQAGQNGLGPARNVDLTGGSVTVEDGSLPAYGMVTLHFAEPAHQQTSRREEQPRTLQVVLRRAGETESNGMAPALFGSLKDGAVEIANVEPGDYRIEPVGSRFHVESITENGQTHSGALLHVTGDGQTVSIALGSGSVAMTGYARAGGKGESGAMVVLVPAGGDHSVDLYRRDQSDMDGSFGFSDVLPGNYLLIAIRDGWDLEWGKPEALAAYLPKAVPLTVPRDAHGAMKLAEDVVVQPR